MSRRKNKSKNGGLVQSGITTDNKSVMAGCYKFYETHGLPLDVLLSTFIMKGWVPDWIELYNSALAAGMEHSRILSKLEEAISDSFGKEWTDVVISTLDKRFKSAEEPIRKIPIVDDSFGEILDKERIK